MPIALTKKTEPTPILKDYQSKRPTPQEIADYISQRISINQKEVIDRNIHTSADTNNMFLANNCHAVSGTLASVLQYYGYNAYPVTGDIRLFHNQELPQRGVYFWRQMSDGNYVLWVKHTWVELDGKIIDITSRQVEVAYPEIDVPDQMWETKGTIPDNLLYTRYDNPMSHQQFLMYLVEHESLYDEIDEVLNHFKSQGYD